MTSLPRSPHTINSELRAVRTILGYLRKLGLLPGLNSDDLRDSLERLSAPIERTDYRKPHELQKLLEAALRHDAEVFAVTLRSMPGVVHSVPRHATSRSPRSSRQRS
ncbi:MAG TPA: hypothetical protein VK524_24440 [Polyangiaceae bacterium]|nr:hypothetical protein [Polyangiaceae bacterium]